MNRLGGWARIGIVISVLWSIGVGGLAGTEYYEFSREYHEKLALPAPPNGFHHEPKAAAEFFEWQSVDLLAKDKSRYVRNYNFSGRKFLAVWLSPIIVLWIFAIAAARTYKWVRAGFSQESSNGS